MKCMKPFTHPFIYPFIPSFLPSSRHHLTQKFLSGKHAAIFCMNATFFRLPYGVRWWCPKAMLYHAEPRGGWECRRFCLTRPVTMEKWLQDSFAWTCFRSSGATLECQNDRGWWCHNDIFLSLRHAAVINHFDSILSRVCMRILDACARISTRLSGSWAQSQIYAPDGCYRRGRSLTVASFFLFSTPLQ